jgi:transmembrane sensor
MLMPEKERLLNLLGRKLAGEASVAEIAEQEALLEKHADMIPVCCELEEYWQNNAALDIDFLEATYLVHLMRLEEKGYHLGNAGAAPGDTHLRPVRSPRKWRYAILPLLVLTLGLFWILRSRPQAQTPAPLAGVPALSPKVEVSTKNGSRTKIQLPDGSQVWLNAGSKLDYDKTFGSQLREVYLSGEAFFDVVKNPQVPFIVHTRTADIKVLGTAFNVRSYLTDKTTETSLIRGSVEVFAKNSTQKWVLKPDEKLVLQNDKVTELAAVKAAPGEYKVRQLPAAAVKKLTYAISDTTTPVETAWVDDKTYFTDEPFADVAKKLERRYDVVFEFKNAVREKMLIHGTFKKETLQQALEALQFSFGFNYTIENKTVLIY